MSSIFSPPPLSFSLWSRCLCSPPFVSLVVSTSLISQFYSSLRTQEHEHAYWVTTAKVEVRLLTDSTSVGCWSTCTSLGYFRRIFLLHYISEIYIVLFSALLLSNSNNYNIQWLIQILISRLIMMCYYRLSSLAVYRRIRISSSRNIRLMYTLMNK